MSKQTAMILGALAVGVAGWFVYRRWKDAQRAAAHPIAILPDSKLLKPVAVNPALVTDAVVIP
jgi:hypothetical protein